MSIYVTNERGDFGHFFWFFKKIIATAAKAVAATVEEIGGTIAAGGWVVLVIIVVIIIFLIIIVVWFDTADFPLNLRFLTTGDALYDVTYLDSSNWTHKYSLLPIAWKKCIPPGQNDPLNHIAVVPSLDVAQNLCRICVFVYIKKAVAMPQVPKNELWT